MSQFYSEKLSVEDEIIRAKIRLQSRSPFYSYLALHLKFSRNDKIKSIGVDPDGNVFWNKEFMERMSNEETQALIVHEISHVALRHCDRIKSRDKEMWNVAVDLITNSMLVENKFSLPKGGLIPRNDCFEFRGQEIENISKKTAEQIYDELVQRQKQKGKGKGKQGQGKGQGEPEYQFDEHISEVQKENKDIEDIKGKSPDGGGNGENTINGNPDSEKNSDDFSKNEEEDLEEKWGRILSEAATRAKQSGEGLTEGIERQIGKLLSPKQNWRSILQREIRQECPVDYSWATPSRRSHEYGIYLPSMKKESINLAIAIDSSGSVDSEELNRFLSTTYDIIQSFQNVNMTVIICDDHIQSVHEFTNANLMDIKKIKVRGEGNTDFQPPIDFVAKKKLDTKLLIYLTDGYSKKPDIKKFSGRILWVLSNNGTDQHIKGTGQILKMER